MLPLQPVDRVQPRLESLERKRLLERFRLRILERSRELAKRIEEALGLLGERCGFRRHPGERAQRSRRPAHRALGASFFRRQRLARRAERLEQPLAMPEPLALLFQGFFLAGRQLRARELRKILAHRLFIGPVALPCGAGLAERPPLLGDRLALPHERQPLVAQARPGVEEFGLALGPEQELMLVLAVQVHEQIADAAKLGEEHGPAVHQGAALSVAGKLPAQDDLPLLGLDPGGANLFQEIGARLEVEDSFDEPALLPRAQPVGVRALAEKEPDRAQDERFPSTRLPREHVERRVEGKLDPVHEREPLNRQPGEHGRVSP